ncbi:MAG: ribonuclease III [Bacteroidota bacterium]
MFRFLKLKKKKTTDELELIRFIIKNFGYRPKNIDFFVKATTHKSIITTVSELSNERLEFLGDTVLDLIIADFLYERFPAEDEGVLTKYKSKIVSRVTLSDIANQMEIRSVLRYNNNRSINLSTIEGNALEALIGAIYLDGGFETTKKSIHHYIFNKFINLNKLLDEDVDFKSKLFIWCQKRHLELNFEVIQEENNGGNWHYCVLANVNERHYGQGIGSSKKKAEQAASKETLELLGVL